MRRQILSGLLGAMFLGLAAGFVFQSGFGNANKSCTWQIYAMDLWEFLSGNYRVPLEDEIEKVLPLVDGSRVKLQGMQVELGTAQQVDLGGIAKEVFSSRRPALLI